MTLKTNPDKSIKVYEYLDKLIKWQQELTALRSIVIDCGLEEDFKWKHPCYTFNKKNIVIIHEFKEYCAISFFKGALLKDLNKILIQPTENIQSGRQIIFKNLNEIIQTESIIKTYIYEAIEVEKLGLQVEMKKTTDYEVPTELKEKFTKDSDFENAFNKLTPGRQRGYLLHFSQPKQSKTRVARIEKNKNRIFSGKGLNDCICGLSKKMPNCDGSHKNLK